MCGNVSRNRLGVMERIKVQEMRKEVDEGCGMLVEVQKTGNVERKLSAQVRQNCAYGTHYSVCCRLRHNMPFWSMLEVSMDCSNHHHHQT